jgi:ABC-type transport system substrate-binding protein
MMKKAVFTVLAIAMMAIMLIPAHAFIFPNCTSDLSFEQFGPRADRLLIHLYADDLTEFAALRAGEIDVEDWPLSKAEYLTDSVPPYNNSLKIVNYGAEYGLYILDFNNNNNTYLGNPPDPGNGNNPADVKVLNPNTGASYNWLADVWLRRAIDYLVDRTALIADPSIGAGFGYPLYTVIPPPQAKYLLNVYGNMSMQWAWYFSPTLCNQTLDAHGYPVGSSGYREYRGQIVKLQFWIRSDHAGRLHIGTVLVALMKACGFYMVENVHFANSGTCHVNVMTNKDFHMYTGGWSLSAQPDFLILWDWAYYWHPGDCYNYDGCNDPAFNAYAEGIMYANSQAEAVSMALGAQMRMAWLNLACPIYCVSGNKAYARWNVNNVDNPGDTTVGQQWWGVVNIMGYGLDNGWSFMDMHTNMTEWGGGMTIDYGFKVPELKQPNIVYASWLYDTNFLGQMYESLLASNASNLAQILPWIATNYTVGLYDNPNLGTCSKVRFTLDPNVVWNDGTPLTMADVYFSMWEIKTDLTARHFPNPWWWSNVQDILSFSVLDPYTFEVLLDVKSYWALYWIGGSYILPKHIWKPIIATGDPTATCPDTNFVATGPWMSKYSWYVPSSHILLVKNPEFHHNGPISCELVVNADHLNKFMPADGLNPPYLLLDCRFDPSMPGHQYVDQINYTITVSFLNTTYSYEDVIVAQGSGVTIPAGGVLKIPFPIPGGWRFGHYEIEWLVWWNCKWPPTAKLHDDGPPVVWYKQYCEMEVYCTIPEDICGSTFYEDIEWPTYPFKYELVSPDILVDVSDVALIAGAFGGISGNARWNAVCDLNHDYLVDVGDLGPAAAAFGFHGEQPPPPSLIVSIDPKSLPGIMALGTSQEFTSSVAGGTPPYSYQWYLNDNAVIGATATSWVFIPTSAGSYTIYLQVTDSAGAKAKSPVVPVTVADLKKSSLFKGVWNEVTFTGFDVASPNNCSLQENLYVAFHSPTQGWFNRWVQVVYMISNDSAGNIYVRKDWVIEWHDASGWHYNLHYAPNEGNSAWAKLGPPPQSLDLSTTIMSDFKIQFAWSDSSGSVIVTKTGSDAGEAWPNDIDVMYVANTTLNNQPGVNTETETPHHWGPEKVLVGQDGGHSLATFGEGTAGSTKSKKLLSGSPNWVNYSPNAVLTHASQESDEDAINIKWLSPAGTFSYSKDATDTGISYDP